MHKGASQWLLPDAPAPAAPARRKTRALSVQGLIDER